MSDQVACSTIASGDSLSINNLKVNFFLLFNVLPFPGDLGVNFSSPKLFSNSFMPFKKFCTEIKGPDRSP